MIIAAALVQLAFAQAVLPEADPAARMGACVALIETSPERAYEEGMAWSAESRRPDGHRCAAMALVELGRPAEGARRLESLALPDGGTPGERAELLSQAGNAWLIAEDAARAQAAFSRAIALVRSEPEFLPDLYIDRARAHAMAGDYRQSEEDLSRALDIRSDDALALRLRAIARMRQSAFDLAEADALRAVELTPSDIDALLVLGHTREAKRIGQPVGD